LAATYADEYNITSVGPEAVPEIRAGLRAACAAIGRDPDSIVLSAMVGVLVGGSEADVRDLVTAQMRMLGMADDAGAAWLEARQARWVMGTPEQAQERIAEFGRVGVERIALQDFLPRDLDMIRFIGANLLPSGGR
jgi:alkanesulfonate monooxygenase SsuD/methylene tetrahydromethanopterin reductase-like flavin-dependent oxidoreductase (luciferase family)